MLTEKPFQEKLTQQREQELKESILKREKRQETNSILKSQIEDNKARKESEFIANLRSENETLMKEMAKLEAQDAESRMTSKQAMKEYLDTIRVQISERKGTRQTGDVMNNHESKVNGPLIEEAQQNDTNAEGSVAFPGFRMQHDRVKQLQMIDKSMKMEESFLQTLDPAKENVRSLRSSLRRRSLIAKLDPSKTKGLWPEKENGSTQTVSFKNDYDFIRQKDKSKNYDIISHVFRNVY